MKPIYTFEVFRGKNKQFYWSIKASNGKKVADSSEGYHKKTACMRFIRRLNSIILDGRPEAIKLKDLTV